MTPSRLPYGRQWIEADDRDAVEQVLASDWLTQGPEVEAFEKDFAHRCGAEHAVAVANGTAALHLACLAAGLGSGQTLITSPITFLASANCGIYCGAEVAFADVVPEAPLLSPRALEQTLSDLQRAGAQPKVLVPVHYAGLCCDMESLASIAAQHGLTVIEDACHALGARWRDAAGQWREVGSCSHSTMAIFSFHPVKHITTGEGGMITTNSAEIAQRLRRLRSHGTQKPPASPDVGGWVNEMVELGLNYRLTDLQCALGRSQLRKLDRWVERRRALIEQYRQGLARLDWCQLLVEPPNQAASYHLAVLLFNPPGQNSDLRSGHGEDGRSLDRAAADANAEIARRRHKLYDFLTAQGLGVQVHYVPVYRQPYYLRRFGFNPGDYLHAERFYASCLSLPLFPSMRDQDVQRVIALVSQAGERGLW